jgi:excinuclease ABC subunit C
VFSFAPMPATNHIADILKRLPTKPGIYQFFDTEGVMLYVGKAKNLKSRVSSYFNKNKYDSGKTRILAKKVDNIKFLVVETEMDALLLENNLIKENQPKYNILLKDDKSFPSIVIKKERFPRIFPTRQLIKDGSEYFGPYASVKTMHKVLDLIRKLYPIRSCSYNLSEKHVDSGKYKICLEYHIGNCLGPCENRISEVEYDKNVGAIRKIIKGQWDGPLGDLKERMKSAAADLHFEKAADYKSKIDLLQSFQARSTIVNPKINKVDIFSIVSDTAASYVNYMKVNNGAIIQGQTSVLKRKLGETDEEVLAYAIPELRRRYQSESKEIYIPFDLELELDDVRFHTPQRGDKLKLIQLSERNAKFYMLDQQKQQDQVDPEASQNRILQTLKDDLRLKEMPRHIECFDNSNIQGTNAASACVVFKNAKPSKADYRKFTIKTVVGPDDFASMEEVVFRRYRRLKEEKEPFPQLIIIDGGKGQLSASLKALDRLELRGQIAIIGIAKKLEEIYFPGDSLPLYIDKRSESLKLIQQLRNEAHRFSLSHHRDKRSKEALKTELTDIKGVGFKTAKDLLLKFKSVRNIKEATIKELQRAVNMKVAQEVWNHFNSPD